MKRTRVKFLLDWLTSSNRKPLVVRGARQVGKTWLVRDFAKNQGLKLVELNFEKNPSFSTLFSSNEPKEILLNLQAHFGYKIVPEESLLFLDEVQAAPTILATLRWFAEEMPEIPVIAAGSLLEFTLAKHEFSMPVGRISYMHLEPLSFEEFLVAIGEEELKKYLEEFHWEVKIPQAIHEKLIKAVKEYLIIGGMPAAVSSWVDRKDPSSVNQIHFDLLATYRDDFAKYSGRLSTDRLDDVLRAIPRQLGQKFVYSRVNSEISSAPIKQALELLSMAFLCHRVVATSGNGLPLGAETNERFTKVIMLDCGLASAALGLSLKQLLQVSEIDLVNDGGMAEQLTGQLLRTIYLPYATPAHYYWQRNGKSNAEIDYLIGHEALVVPIEVKAGKTGSLKSLHQFMSEKKKSIAVRINSDFPSKGPVCLKDTLGQPVDYQLFSIPFYLIGQLDRIIS